jgi:glycosyltransferase involved in cell wall biosynthesis
MSPKAPATGWRALPRKCVTALRLGWRLLRRTRALPGFLHAAYETSLVPAWNEGRGTWRGRFRPGRLAGALGRGAAGLLFAKPVVYQAPLPAAAGRVPRPRILHAIPNVFVGGSTQLIYDLCGALGERYEMQILTSATPAGGAHRGVPIRVVPHPATTAAIAAAIAAAAPEIVHIHYWGEVDHAWYAAVLAAAKASGARIVQNVNTPVAPIADDAIAATIFVSAYVRDAFGAGIANAHVIHPGIDLAHFAPPAAFDAEAERSIGMVYRLEPDKLKPDAIDVLIAVCRARPRTRAVVVGSGSLFAGFVARTRAAGVRGQFWFTGAVPYAALPEIYSRFRIFVAPVWKESFGQVTPFAMHMGQAVAGNRIGALAEILGSDATLGATPDATAALVVGLLDDPARTAALGAHNRAAAARLYNVSAMNAAYGAVYDAVLGPAADPMAGFPPAQVFA